MAILESLKELPDQDDIIEDLNIVDNDNKFTASIRSKIYDAQQGSNYSGWCDAWIKKFSAKTCTNWIVRYTYPNAQKYLYRKVFKCQHNSFDKVKNRKRTNSRNRDKECDATINILFKKINKGTVKNDVHLKTGLNIKVEISFEHNHNVVVSEAFSFLRMSEETEKIFLQYFEDGMTPSVARNYHEVMLESLYDKNDIYVYLANAQVNSSERQVNYLYEK